MQQAQELPPHTTLVTEDGLVARGVAGDHHNTILYISNPHRSHNIQLFAS